MRRRGLSLAARRRLLQSLDDIAEGPPLEHDDASLYLFTGWTGVQIILQASFEAFDGLPKPVRRLLHQAVVTWEPAPIADWLLQHRAVRYHQRIAAAKRAIRQAEAADIATFNSRHIRQYRCPLPHIAARATILRYDSARNRRKGRIVLFRERRENV